MIEVFVKTVAGKTRTLRVLSTDTAAVVKGELQSKEGILQEEQRLIFGGKQLEGVRSLAFFGIQQHSTLQLLLRLLGGGPNHSRTCCRPSLPRVLHLPGEPPEREGQPQGATQGVGRALPLLDGIAGGPGVDAIVSFPGAYEDTWNDMVATALLLKHLGQQLQLPEETVPRILSTACIFLPHGNENFGKHHPNDVDEAEVSAGHCFCHKLYGEKREWGCRWFHLWRGRLEEALDRGQKPVVVYKSGEVGEGDDVTWERFSVPSSTEHSGLGSSQKGEVAFLKKRLEERGIARFEKRDVDQVSKIILEELNCLKEIIKGFAGGLALADAIEHCKEVQDALGTLSLGETALGEAGSAALARSLPRLRALQRLVLSDCDLGRGAAAVATSLQHLPKLVQLHLARDDFGGQAGEALAANLRHLPELRELYLFDNRMGDAVGQAIAASLQRLPMLSNLHLGNNGLGEEAGKAVAASLQYLPELEVLRLGRNRLGEEAGQALAASLHKLPKLCRLDLSQNQLEEGAGRALAASLRNLPKLSELHLDHNKLGQEAGKALVANLQHLPGLKELGLAGNRLGEAGGVGLAASLEQLPLLEDLNLRGNPLGERAKGLLRKKWGTRYEFGLRL